jgi:putative FmdB family regulatory protein
MARYDYQCSKCSYVEEKRHGMMEEPRYKCDKCEGDMSKVFLTVPALTVPYHMQGAPNEKKHWGSKPIKDIQFTNDDGSVTVIPGENSDLQ